MTEKLDRSKKLRLSLDKFVPKNKQVSKYASIFDTCQKFIQNSISVTVSLTNL